MRLAAPVSATLRFSPACLIEKLTMARWMICNTGAMCPTETSAYEAVESWLNSGGDHMSTHLPSDRPVAEPGQQSLGRRIRRFAETVRIALFDFAA